MKTTPRFLVCLLLPLLAAACGGAADMTADATGAGDCAAFDECSTRAGASIACADGECACTYTHPGENEATTCLVKLHADPPCDQAAALLAFKSAHGEMGANGEWSVSADCVVTQVAPTLTK